MKLINFVFYEFTLLPYILCPIIFVDDLDQWLLLSTFILGSIVTNVLTDFSANLLFASSLVNYESSSRLKSADDVILFVDYPAFPCKSMTGDVFSLIYAAELR